jgi:GNAT superfamily N-acetyltransferase
MAHRLRLWTDGDTGSDAAISREIYPEYREEPLHPAWFPAQQLGAPREYSSRYVVVESQTDRPVAFAALWELRPRRYRFDLAVRPEWQRQGIATQLLSQVTGDAQALGATGLQARVRDDKPEAIQFICKRGFLEVHRMGAYRLDFVQTVPGGPEEAFAQSPGGGIQVASLAALRERDPQCIQRFHELYCAAREAWPDPDPDPAGPTPVPLEQIQRWLNDVNLPEAFIVAMHGQRYIGFTSFFEFGTGVHPEYRRRGIATWLKRVSIADAQQRGYLGQTTSTASPGMEAVLEKLGYRRIWSEIRLMRAIG